MLDEDRGDWVDRRVFLGLPLVAIAIIITLITGFFVLLGPLFHAIVSLGCGKGGRCCAALNAGSILVHAKASAEGARALL